MPRAWQVGKRHLDAAQHARLQLVQPPRPDRHPHQTQRRQTDLGGHAPHLAVLAFADDDLQPGIRHRLAKAHRRLALPQSRRFRQHAHFGRLSNEIAKIDPGAQRGQLVLVRPPFHLHPVGLRQLPARIADAVLQLAVAGEQQQPFAVGVQPPGRVDAGLGDAGLERGMQGVLGKLANHAVGLVEQEELGHVRAAGIKQWPG